MEAISTTTTRYTEVSFPSCSCVTFEFEISSERFVSSLFLYSLAKSYQLLLLLFQCLSILNYFRSLERMITIYDAGLSAESEKSRGATEQNHRRGVDTDAVGGGNGLGSHSYVYNTPADFK